MVKKQLTLIPLIGIIYFTVSGGAFGLENIISGAGPGFGMLLLLLTPLMWSLPIALVTAELSTMMPIDGGYYRWVYFALGRFWGFQEGWWTWLFTFVDMAVYPVLFSTSLKFFWPGMTAWQQWLVNLAVIFTALAINWRGAKSVGNTAIIAFVIITGAFLILTIFAATKMTQMPWVPFATTGKSLTVTLGAGLTAVMWSYMGWDNVSTFAGEVKNPSRTFPLALMLAVLLVTLLYIFPMVTVLSATTNWQQWDSDNFTIAMVASELVSPWLGSAIALSVMFSVWSMFVSQLLYTSRLPFTMAEDGLLPKVITKTTAKYGTPYVSLLICAVIYSIFTMLSFKRLLVIDVLIYAIALVMEYAALIRLRKTHPEMTRPFKIPGGAWGIGLAFVSLLIFVGACAVFAILGEEDSWKQVVVVIAMLTTGPVVYAIQARINPAPRELEWIDRLCNPVAEKYSD
jgi:amino acid transporter